MSPVESASPVIMRSLLLAALLFGPSGFVRAQHTPASGVPIDDVRIELLAPSRAAPGERVPVVARARTPSGRLHTGLSDSLTLLVDGAPLPGGVLVMKKGVGSVTVPIDAAADVVLSLAGLRGERRLAVHGSPAVAYAGTLDASAVWDASADRLITADLTVPEGVTLTIEAGARLLFSDRANLIVRGTLDVNGTPEEPVLFTSADGSAPWGGVEIHGPPTRLRYAFFVNGGADETRARGHSASQPVLLAWHADAYLRHTFFLDNVGKALGMQSSRLHFSEGLVSRCDAGGFSNGGLAHITHSHFLDIPDGDGRIEDDDNDGYYFSGATPGMHSLVDQSFFVTGEDDAIDHNAALLDVRNSWLEGFHHECLAGSNGNRVRVFNSVLKGCEQGVEAGYGDPLVQVSHSVIVGHEVGVRFGDSYDWGCEGRMEVEYSIVADNDRPVLNFDRLTGGAVPGAVGIRHTLFDSAYATGYGGACPGCVVASPLFDDSYRLRPSSPGIGLASNELDVGLLGGGLFLPPLARAPEDAQEDTPPDTPFRWDRLDEAAGYHVQIDRDPFFLSPVVDDSTLTDTLWTPPAPLDTHTVYYWRVRGRWDLPGPWSPPRRLTTGARFLTGRSDGRPAPPGLLGPLYPNPTSGPVHVAYTLDRPARVLLTVHDLLGRRVATLEDGVRTAGTRRLAWTGSLPAGLYVVRLQAGARMETATLLFTP